MAIKATQLHYDFIRKFNRINSASGRYISVAERDSYLTEAYHIYFENRAALVDVNPLVRNDLRQFEIKRECITPSRNNGESSFIPYPENFYSLLRTATIASTDECGEEKELLTHKIQSDDISESLKSPFWKPSYEYEETFADEAQDGLYIYHNGVFNIIRVCIDYLKKPGVIRAPSLAINGNYIDANGETVTQDVDLELDSTFAWRKITDIAVLIAARDVSDVQEFESQLGKILRVESLYTQ